MKKLRYILPIILLITLFNIPAAAQAPKPGGENTPGQGFQGRRGMMTVDPEQMQQQIQQMMSDRFKEQLGISDEEWVVIGPKVMKVLTLSSQSMGNPMRMMIGRPGAQGFGPQGPGQQRPGQQGRPNIRDRISGIFGQNGGDDSMLELQNLLEDENADTNKIKQLVAKVRREREKSQRELAAAKKELRELLTVRQEAILISMGLLD